MKITKNRLIQIINEEISLQKQEKEPDLEGNMAKSQLFQIQKYAQMLNNMLSEDSNLEPWVQAKITLASDYLSKVKHYLEYEAHKESGCAPETIYEDKK